MYPYILIIAIYFSLLLLKKSLEIKYDINTLGNKHDLPYVLFFSLVLILFSGLRDGIGWDYHHYYETILFEITTNITERGELLSILLVEFAREMSSPAVYFLLNSLIVIGLISITLIKYSKNPYLSIYIFACFPLFYLNSFSVVRFFSALAIVFFATRFLVNKNPVKYLICIFLAGFMHLSAFIMLPVYLICTLKISRAIAIILVCLTPVIQYSGNEIVNNFFPIFSVYTEAAKNKEGRLAIIVFVAILIALFPIWNKATKEITGRIFINIYFFGIVIYLSFYEQGTMGHRLSLYGTIYSIILVPTIIKYYPESYRVLMYFLAYTGFFVMYLYIIVIGAETYLPYNSVF